MTVKTSTAGALAGLAAAASLGSAPDARAAFLTPAGVTASSNFDTGTPGTGAINLINPAFLTVNSPLGTHDNNGNAQDMWNSQVLSSPSAAANEFLIFDLGSVYNLTGTYVWNENQVNGNNNATARGVNTEDIYTSPDGVTFTPVQLGATFNQAGGTPAEPAQFDAFTAPAVRYVEFENFTIFNGPFNNVVGLSAVRFDGTAVPEPGHVGLGCRRRRAGPGPAGTAGGPVIGPALPSPALQGPSGAVYIAIGTGSGRDGAASRFAPPAAARPRMSKRPPDLNADQLDRGSSVPLHAQIERLLRRVVQSDPFRHGRQLLPGEVVLARRLNVSRNTLRAAMGKLEAEGLLHRKRRVGTSVASADPPHSSLLEWYSFTAEMKRQGITVENFALSVGPHAPPPEVVTALQLPDAGPVLKLERTRGWGGRPVVLAQSWLHPSLGLRGDEDYTRPLYAIVRHQAGVTPHVSREAIRAVLPTAAEARKLKVDAGTPLLLRARTIYDRRGRPIEQNYNWYVTTAYGLTLELGGRPRRLVQPARA